MPGMLLKLHHLDRFLDIQTSTTDIDKGSIPDEAKSRWFVGFNEQTPSTSFNEGETEKSMPSRGVTESVQPQRSDEVLEALGDSEVEIDEADCLPETDTKSQFVTAEDSFGRIRRLKLGSATAKRVQEGDKLREKRLEHEKEAAFQAERRPVASYEDI